MTAALNMNAVLDLFEPTDAVSAETIATLKGAFGEVPVAEIGDLKKHEFALRIKAKAATVKNAIGVAGAVLDFMRENEFVSSDAPATAAAPQMPTSIKLELPANPATMSLRQLLELIVEDNSRFGEVEAFLVANPQYAAAARKTAEIAIPKAGGGLDVDATLAYIGDLARPHSKVQRERNGQRPTTLGKALGFDIRPLVHPFTGGPITGPDENGFDFSRLPDELHRALIWARTVRHDAWPSVIDPFEHGEEILADTLKQRWQRILSDYRHAVEQEDPQAVGITRYWTETSRRGSSTIPSRPRGGVESTARAPFDRQPSFNRIEELGPNDDYYRSLVERAVRSANCDVTGTGASKNGGVYNYLNLSGTGASAYVTILRGGSARGTGASGTIRVPIGVDITVSGTGSSVDVQHCTWEELARHLRLI